jgi:TRAP-type mannitol/chloroaromatic compound transport system permease small subunit
MPRAIELYVRAVDRVGRLVGRATMYMIFAMIGVLLYSSISKAFFLPALWTVEFAQFMMVAYFLLGGAYSLQMGSHVRMDLLYGVWSPRRKAAVDSVTIILLIAFLILLLWGGVSSTTYAIEYGERSYSAWRPYMWPIKVVMVFGIVLMLLQAIAQFFKDIAAARGQEIGVPLPEKEREGS